jgi:hypothetical protein
MEACANEPKRTVAIEILPTAWMFNKGHRIRIDISSADSAGLDAPWTYHYGTRMGRDTYHHDQAGPSRLMLPILPADAWIGEPTPPVQWRARQRQRNVMNRQARAQTGKLAVSAMGCERGVKPSAAVRVAAPFHPP